MEDVLGNALTDYQQGVRKFRLYINNRYGKKEVMPVSVYFRNLQALPKLEVIALEACTGKVLDIGAAAGSHALLLQHRGVHVTALDTSPSACAVMQQRGVANIIHADIFAYKQKKFDTLLLLMNGIGLAGSLEGLRKLLQSLRSVLKPGGQILFDSSDVAYLYRNKHFPEHYYGEIDYEYSYRDKHSGWFRWLYIDKKTMAGIAAEMEFTMKVLFQDNHGQYVARLTTVM